MATRLLTSIFVLALAGAVQAQNSPADNQVPAPPSKGVPQPPTTAAPAGPAPHIPECCPPEQAAGSRLWGGAEYLVWWVQGQRIPALVTTSPTGTPLGQAGVLGQPGTGILFGDTRISDHARHGVRLTLGTWLDDCRTCGIGGEFFILGDSTGGYSLASQGSPIIMRPFFNTLTNQHDAEVVAFPGISSGGIEVDSTSQLMGAGLFTRHLMCEGCFGCGNSYRFESLLGYRYLNLYEEVSITEQVNSTSTVPGAPPLGTSFLINDTFRTLNQFHGADVGVLARLTRDRLCFTAQARLAFGWTIRELKVDGFTNISVPGQPTVPFPGGLYSVGKLGETDSTIFSLVPEVRLALGYMLTERACVSLGYNLMWWTGVARAGDNIDVRVNTNQLPPPIGPVVNQVPSIRDTSIWIQGFTVGLTYDY